MHVCEVCKEHLLSSEEKLCEQCELKVADYLNPDGTLNTEVFMETLGGVIATIELLRIPLIRGKRIGVATDLLEVLSWCKCLGRIVSQPLVPRRECA